MKGVKQIRTNHDKTPILLIIGLLLTINLFTNAHSAQADWSGRVVWVQDGDSIIIMHGNKRKTVRLQGIDCPEKGQPYAKQATKAAIDLAKDRTVRVLVKELDKFGRTVASVILPDGTDLGKTLVSRGLAWRHIYYAEDPTLKTLEAAAKKARRGLWRDKNPIPPWVWKRKQHRQSSRQNG